MIAWARAWPTSGHRLNAAIGGTVEVKKEVSSVLVPISTGMSAALFNGHGDRQALAVLVLAQVVQSVATAHDDRGESGGHT